MPGPLDGITVLDLTCLAACYEWFSFLDKMNQCVGKVLGGCGISQAEIDQLREKGVLR